MADGRTTGWETRRLLSRQSLTSPVSREFALEFRGASRSRFACPGYILSLVAGDRSRWRPGGEHTVTRNPAFQPSGSSKEECRTRAWPPRRCPAPCVDGRAADRFQRPDVCLKTVRDAASLQRIRSRIHGRIQLDRRLFETYVWRVRRGHRSLASERRTTVNRNHKGKVSNGQMVSATLPGKLRRRTGRWSGRQVARPDSCFKTESVPREFARGLMGASSSIVACSRRTFSAVAGNPP